MPPPAEEASAALSALFAAAARGNLPSVRLVLEHAGEDSGVSARAADARGDTPLHVAARHEHWPVVSWLVGPGGANPEATNAGGQNPMDVVPTPEGRDIFAAILAGAPRSRRAAVRVVARDHLARAADSPSSSSSPASRRLDPDPRGRPQHPHPHEEHRHFHPSPEPTPLDASFEGWDSPLASNPPPRTTTTTSDIADAVVDSLRADIETTRESVAAFARTARRGDGGAIAATTTPRRRLAGTDRSPFSVDDPFDAADGGSDGDDDSDDFDRLDDLASTRHRLARRVASEVRRLTRELASSREESRDRANRVVALEARVASSDARVAELESSSATSRAEAANAHSR